MLPHSHGKVTSDFGMISLANVKSINTSPAAVTWYGIGLIVSPPINGKMNFFGPCTPNRKRNTLTIRSLANIHVKSL